MKVFSLAGVLLLAAVCSFADVKIDLKNAVVSYSAAPYKYAAMDLAKHLELIGGCKIPVVAEKSVPAGKYVFYVGKAPASDKTPVKPEEGRYLVTPGAAYFYGCRERGYGHAVYLFLEDELGVRWPGVDEIVYPEMNPITVKTLSRSFVPALNIRTIRGQGIWNTRMRCGSHNPPQYGHAFTKWWKRFGKTHPEYFAMNNGRRAPTVLGAKSGDIAIQLGPKVAEGIALCVSSDAVADQIIEDWKKQGMPEYINLCENDAPDNLSCHCAKCMALDVLTPAQQKDWTHALADRYIYLAKNVLKRAKKYRKDAKISMYAYNASQDAPRREKLPEDIVIGIVPTNFTFPSLSDYVASWKKVGLKHFFYRPNRHYYYAISVPAGFDKHFFDVMQYLYKQGSIGFDYDAQKTVNPTVQFSDYLLAKSMQDPSKPYEYWVKHYLSAYGPAAANVGKYLEYWRKNVWEKRIAAHVNEITDIGSFYNYGRGLCYTMGKYYRDSDFAEAGKYLDAALKTPGLTKSQKAQVQRLADFNTHARLIFNAVSKKTDDASIALLKYRKAHKLKLLEENEQYYGDVCGIKRVMDLGEFTPPFIQTDLIWRFKLDPKNVGLKEGWYKAGRGILSWKDCMATNHCWEKPYKQYKSISESIRKQTANYDGVAWYATSINVPADWRKDREVYLYFGAVDESAWVYVNGEEAGRHLYVKSNDWTTPFAINITRQLKGNARTPQVVIVRVEDKAGAGGIWKRVWLVSKKK